MRGSGSQVQGQADVGSCKAVWNYIRVYKGVHKFKIMGSMVSGNRGPS